MKTLFNSLFLSMGLFLLMAVSYDDGDSYCVIFPQNGRDIFGVEQRNIIIIGDNEVSLIPQVHFEGNARDFGIFVPVPAEPKLATVSSMIFSEASFMTQPLVRQSSQSCACNESNQIFNSPDQSFASLADGAIAEASKSGVTVIYEQIVGTFQAVVLQATNADDLVQWLDENNYRFNPSHSQLLEEYITKNWFFVAMKLDTSQVPQHINQWWNATTSPAKITFAFNNDKLTYPLKISSISTKERMEVLVYTIGPHPMRFPGAKVEYANLIDADEAEAIAEIYPAFSEFIPPGVFVTKLRKTFTKSEMQQDMDITISNDRREFREIRYRASGLNLIGLMLLAYGLFRMRRSKKLVH